MDYKNDDIEFANRLLTRREELNDEEVTAWLKEKDHVELLDEIAAIRQKLSGQSYGESGEEEFQHLEKSIYDQKSRRMTLRWSIAASIILLVGLFVGRTINEVRDMHEEQVLVKNVMQPGTSKAILMMADGKEVVLEQGQNLNILLNERVRVATNSRGIVYEEHGKGVVTEEYNKLTTPIGGEYSLVLSDGTKVFLNADSELKYPVEFSDGKRIVDLKGEAYFEVAKNHSKPFIVKLKNQQITVLGTSFNIQAFNDDRFSVTTLLSGSILLESFDAQGRKMSSMKLKPNQQARSDNRTGSIFLSETDASISNAWVGGKYRFKDETLVSIVKRLENYYGVNIRLAHDSLRNIRYTGTFSLDQGIQEVLDIINSEKQFTFTKDGKDILISARSK